MKRIQAWVKRAIIFSVGGIISIVGLVLIPLPGPGTLILMAGLAILGIEFAVARRAHGHLRERFQAAGRRAMKVLRPEKKD